MVVKRDADGQVLAIDREEIVVERDVQARPGKGRGGRERQEGSDDQRHGDGSARPCHRARQPAAAAAASAAPVTKGSPGDHGSSSECGVLVERSLRPASPAREAKTSARWPMFYRADAVRIDAWRSGSTSTRCDRRRAGGRSGASASNGHHGDRRSDCSARCSVRSEAIAAAPRIWLAKRTVSSRGVPTDRDCPPATSADALR
jgi:hypothetical protein